MKRYTTIAMLMGAALLAQVSTASAQRWGREATPRAGRLLLRRHQFQRPVFLLSGRLRHRRRAVRHE